MFLYSERGVELLNDFRTQIIFGGGVLVMKWLKRWTAESLSASSNSSRTITFTFGQISLGNV